MPRARALVVVASSGKTDINKVGLNSVKDDVVRNNLMGKSRKMASKDWTDSQGRKGKGYGVYRFADKYGANVDGYSPIYTPDLWSESGESYKLGAKGLVAWCVVVFFRLFVVFLFVVCFAQPGPFAHQSPPNKNTKKTKKGRPGADAARDRRQPHRLDLAAGLVSTCFLFLSSLPPLFFLSRVPCARVAERERAERAR